MQSLVDILVQSGPLLLQGALMTIKLWFFTALISLSIGTILGILQSEKVWIPIASTFIACLTFLFRSIPFYVQLLLVYFVVPDFFGISFSTTTAGIIALGICSSSYMSQIIRAGINAIPVGQWEACYALGFSRITMLRYIILPQMLRAMLPAIINELESVLKSTSIISTIGVLELTRIGMNIVSREMNPLSVYCTVACMYLVMSCFIELIVRGVQRKYKL